MLASFHRILSLFSLIKEKFNYDMEYFDWWKHLPGYSLRIRDELLFNMKLSFDPLHHLHKSSCFQTIHICTLKNFEYLSR